MLVPGWDIGGKTMAGDREAKKEQAKMEKMKGNRLTQKPREELLKGQWDFSWYQLLFCCCVKTT